MTLTSIRYFYKVIKVNGDASFTHALFSGATNFESIDVRTVNQLATSRTLKTSHFHASSVRLEQRKSEKLRNHSRYTACLFTTTYCLQPGKPSEGISFTQPCAGVFYCLLLSPQGSCVQLVQKCNWMFQFRASNHHQAV